MPSDVPDLVTRACADLAGAHSRHKRLNAEQRRRNSDDHARALAEGVEYVRDPTLAAADDEARKCREDDLDEAIEVMIKAIRTADPEQNPWMKAAAMADRIATTEKKYTDQRRRDGVELRELNQRINDLEYVVLDQAVKLAKQDYVRPATSPTDPTHEYFN